MKLSFNCYSETQANVSFLEKCITLMPLMLLFMYSLRVGVKKIHFEFYKRWSSDLVLYYFREPRGDASYSEASFPEVASPARTWRLCVFLRTNMDRNLLKWAAVPVFCGRMLAWKAYSPIAGAELSSLICRDQRKLKYFPSVCLHRCCCCFQLVIMDLYSKLFLVRRFLDGDVFEVTNMSEINKADPHGCDNGALTDRFGVLIQGLLAIIAFSTLMGKFLFPQKQPNRSVFADGWSK